MFVDECSWRTNAAHNKSSFSWLNDIWSSADVCCFYPPSHYSSSGSADLNELTFIFAWLPEKHCRSADVPPNSFSSDVCSEFSPKTALYITASLFSSPLQNCDASFAYFRLFFLESLSRRPGACSIKALHEESVYQTRKIIFVSCLICLKWTNVTHFSIVPSMLCTGRVNAESDVSKQILDIRFWSSVA